VAGSGGKVSLGQAAQGIALLDQESSEVFELESQLPDAASFTYAVISKGYFDGNNRFQGEALTLPETFVFSARGSEGTVLGVQVVDINGVRAEFKVALRPVDLYYTLDFQSAHVLPAFDPSKVAQILFVQDQSMTLGRSQSLVRIRTLGLAYTPVELPPELVETRDLLIQEGAKYFTDGIGIDPVTHFTYDSITASGAVDASAKFTQPTIIGFQLQILADIAAGKIQSTLTSEQALAEINRVLDSLLAVQRPPAEGGFGWNGLIPWLFLEPLGATTDWIGLGDNANLSQSVAVMIGSLESALGDTAKPLTDKAETFLDRQRIGYEKMVDPFFGIFAATVNSKTGIFNHFMDRLVNEFRGSIAFLSVRYPTLPATVWDKLNPVMRDYTDRDGNVITNFAPFDGGAFQVTWPGLRNRETDFLGFRNALYNHLVTQTDNAYQRHLPGFVSASQRPDNRPEGDYYGRLGMTELAELPSENMITDVGSTYALAAAYASDPLTVLSWLSSIRRQIPSLDGTYGLLDAARSGSEVGGRFLAIDIASTVLGLLDSDPDAFSAYLKKRGLELSYNLLYDRKSQFDLEKTSAVPAPEPVLADRSLAVFSRYTGHGAINGYPYDTTDVTGARFLNGELEHKSGVFWQVPSYDARNNQIEIVYTAADTPKKIRLELKNSADQTVYEVDVTLADAPTRTRIVIDLPGLAALSDVGFVMILVDQGATGDTSADFYIHSLNFQHLSD